MNEMKTHEKLTALGWREYPDQFKPEARMFCKQFDTPTRCAGNDDHAGIKVSFYIWPEFADSCESFEIEICGEVHDEIWVKIKSYSLPNSLDEALAHIPRMLAAWEAMAA